MLEKLKICKGISTDVYLSNAASVGKYIIQYLGDVKWGPPQPSAEWSWLPCTSVGVCTLTGNGFAPDKLGLIQDCYMTWGRTIPIYLSIIFNYAGALALGTTWACTNVMAVLANGWCMKPNPQKSNHLHHFIIPGCGWFYPALSS